MGIGDKAIGFLKLESRYSKDLKGHEKINF
jgi:hypothetical protein